MIFLLPLTGAANISIGGDAAPNGIIHPLHLIITTLGCVYLGIPWLVSLLAAAITTAAYAIWRSQSPRGADLDLGWEHPNKKDISYGRKTTRKEVLTSLKLHGIPLTVIAVVTQTWWLPLLASIAPIGHLLAWNKSKLGAFLYSKDSGYPRRFGELLNGILMHGIALMYLLETTLNFLINIL